jgi:hypothetical protein
MRALRTALRTAAIMVAGGLAVVALLVGIVHTGPGFAIARTWTEAALNDEVFRGTLSIGELEGFLGRRFALTDLALTDASGQPAVTIERLEVDYDLWALLGGAVRVHEVSIHRPQVYLRMTEEGVNLARLLRREPDDDDEAPEETGPFTAPLPIDVRVRLSDGRFEGPRTQIRVESLAGEFSARGPQLVASVESLRGELQAPVEGPVEGTGRYALDDGRHRVEGLALDVAGSTVRSDGFTFLPLLVADGDLSVTLLRDHLGAWLGSPEWTLPVAVELRAEGGQQWTGTGRVGTGTVDLSVVRTASAARGRLRGRGLRTRAFTQRAPDTTWDLDARGEVGSDGTGTMVVSSTTTVAGSWAAPLPRTVSSQIRAVFDQAADIDLRVSGTGLTATVAARLADLRSSLRLERLDVALGVVELAALPWPTDRPAPSGRASVNLRWAEGAGTVDATVTGGGAADVRFDRGTLQAEMSADPRGLRLRPFTGELRVDGLRWRERDLGDWAVRTAPRGDAAVAVTVRARGAGRIRRVELAGLTRLSPPWVAHFDAGRIETSSAAWAIDPWDLRWTQARVRVDGFAARADPDVVRLDLDLATRSPWDGRAQGKLQFGRLGVFSEWLPELRAGSIDLRGSGEWNREGGTADVEAELSGIRLRSIGDDFDVGVRSRLRGRRLSVEARAEGPAVGGVDLDAEADWLPYAPRALRRLRLRVDGFRLPSLLSVRGTAAGLLRFDRDSDRLFGDLTVASPSSSDGPPWRLLARVTGDGEQTTAAASLHGDVPLVRARALGLPSPSRLMAGTRWTGTLSVLAPAVTAERVGAFLPPPFDAARGGPIELVATATRSSSDTRAELRLAIRDVEPYPAAPRITGLVEGQLTEAAWTTNADVSGHGLGALSWSTTSSTPPWQRPMPDRGSLRVVDGRIAGLRSLLALPLLRTGGFDGDLRWEDGGRRAKGRLRGRGLSAGRGLHPLDTSLTLDVAPPRTELKGDVSADGTRLLTGEVVVRPPRPGAPPLDPASQVEGRLDSVDARLERVFAESTDDFQGAIDLDAAIEGRLDALEGRLGLRMQGATVGGTILDRLIADVAWSPGGLDLRADLEAREGGRLHAQLDAQGPEVTGAIEAEAMDLGFLTAPLTLTTGSTGLVQGKLTGRASVEGPKRDPRASGSLRIDGLAMAAPGALPDIQDGVLRLDFDRRRFELTVEGDASEAGRLATRLEGDLAGSVSGGIVGRAELKASNVGIVAGPVVTRVDTVATAEFQDIGPTLQVDLLLGRTTIRLPDEDAARYYPITEPRDVVRVETFGVRPQRDRPVRPSGAPPDVRLGIQQSEPMELQGTKADGTIRLDLVVLIDGRRIVTEGDLDVRSGRAELFGRDYRVTRAVVTFTGGPELDPRLDLELVHAFDSVTLTVNITGPASEPDVRFSSSPAIYDQAQLLSFFTGLADPDRPGRSSNLAASGTVLLAPIQNQLVRRLPIDSLDFTTQGNRPVVTVGKWLSETVFVAAGYNGAQDGPSAYEGLVRWRFLPGWVLEAIASINDQSADLLWSKRF